MKRAIKILFIALIALILLIIGSVFLVLNNESLTRQALIKATDFVPGLSLKDSQGVLWQGLHLQGLRYHLDDTVDVNINDALLHIDSLSLLRGKLIIRELSTKGLVVSILSKADDSITSEISSTESGPITLPELITPVHIGLLDLSLTDSTLKVGELSLPIDSLKLSAYWRRDTLAINNAKAHSDQYRAELNGNVYMQGDWPLNVSASWFAPLPENVATLFSDKVGQGDIQVRGTVRKLNIEQQTRTPLLLSGNVQLAAFDSPLSFSVKQTWQPFDVLLSEENPLSVHAGTVSVAGNLDAFIAELNTQLTMGAWPSVAITFKGEGNTEHAKIESLLLENSDSKVQLTGDVSWQEHIQWDIKALIEKLNPALVLADFPGEINATLQSQGSFGEQLNGLIKLDDIRGQLRQQRLSGHVDANIEQTKNLLIDSELNLGDNRIALRGSAADKYALDLDINAKNLNQILPDLNGAVTLSAQLRGDEKQPLLAATAEASNAGFQAIQLEKLLLNLRSDLQRLTMQGELQLSKLTQGGNTLVEQLDMSLQGNRAAYLIGLKLNNAIVETGLNLKAKSNQSNWYLTLSNWYINGENAGYWRQQKVADMTLNTSDASLSQLCLVQESDAGLFCLSGNKKAQNIEANVDLQHLSLAPLASFIDASAQIQGHLNAKANLSLREGIMQAKANLDVSSGHIRMLDEQEETLRVEWQTLTAFAEVKDNRYQASLGFVMNPSNAIQANAKGLLGENGSIDANLGIQFDQLHWLELFAPVQQVVGVLEGTVKLKGALNNPDIDANLQLRDGSLQVEMAGINLDNIGLNIKSLANGSIVINGKLFSDGKALNLDGFVDRSNAFPWPVQLNISGEDILLLNISEAVVRVDPKIQISIADQLVLVRGNILVRQASITLRDLPDSVVSVSNDAIIVGEEHLNTGMQTDIDVKVTLGEKVSVEGMGLTARFTGDVRIEDKPQRPLSVTGLVQIKDGRYRAYGQNLRIERGNLYFQGPPNDPGLDIVATRSVSAYSAKAGLEIGGTLQNPRSRIFSEPAMDETDAMSLLLTGKPLSGANESEGNAILQAIIVYGIEQGDFITGRISDTLGIDVGFDTDGETNEAAFMMGKQLSSKLYLRYSVSLFESISTFMLRYRLGRYVNLETRTSSENQSIDLIYRRERN